MKECQQCGAAVEEWETTCTSCGAELLGGQSGHRRGGQAGGQHSGQPGQQGRQNQHRQPQEQQGGQPHSQQGAQSGGQQGWDEQRQQGQPSGQRQPGGGGQPRGQGSWEQEDDGTSRRSILAGGGVLAAAAAGGWFVFLRGDDETSAESQSGEEDEPTTAASPGNDFETAPEIGAGEYGPYQITEGENHYFAVELLEDDELTAHMYFTHDDGDLDISLYNPRQQRETSALSISDDETVSLVASTAGTYYVNPYGVSTASNSYRFEIVIE